MKCVLFFILLLCSCSQNVKESNDGERPIDVSTNRNRQDIDQVKFEIQTLADQIGVPGNFKDFPVIVVEKYPGQDGPLAYCHESQNQSVRYIGIVKETMENYLLEPYSHQDNSFLFKLLVHEFGHCIFNRGHDETMIGKAGFTIFFLVPGLWGDELKPIGSEIAVSAMASINWWMTGLPKDIKKYYLREIAGQVRWRTPVDLQSQPGLRLIQADSFH